VFTETQHRLASCHAAILVFLIVGLTSHVALASPFSPGSRLLVFGDGLIGEFAPNGLLIQTIDVPYPGGRPATEIVRDITLNSDGTLSIYNGTFDPHLTIFDAETNTFTHRTFPGWSSDGNLSFGAIASFQQFVFVSDNSTFGDGGQDLVAGVVRFDRSGGPTLRHELPGPFELAMGLDGLLYVLATDTHTVHVLDPEAFVLLRTVVLTAGLFGPASVFGIAVNGSGEILGAANTGGLTRFDASGVIIESVPGPGLHDLELDPGTGQLLALVVPSFLDQIFLAGEDLVGATAPAVSGSRFAAFGPPVVSVPQASTGLLVVFALAIPFGRYVYGRYRSTPPANRATGMPMLRKACGYE
jgi:hypothetical protein